MTEDASKGREYYGADAIKRTGHLLKTSVDSNRWELHYLDPLTNESWVLDYPSSELHGGGSPRLRKIEKAGIGYSP